MAIKIKILNIATCILSSTFVVASYAQGDFASPATASKIKKASKAKTKTSDAGQAATIKVDGSAVYEVANFDSPVLEYMDRGKKVRISKKIYPGIGGLGAFYKIRIKKGVYGYIADTDAEVANKRYAEKDRSDDEDDDDDENLENGSDPTKFQSGIFSENDPDEKSDAFYLTRYVGFAFASYNYAEVIRNKTEVSQTSMLGVKLTGPTGYMGGMPLDINLLFTTTAPSFYSKVANSTSGFMLIGDALVTLPLYESKSILVFYGFGPVIRYSSWQVKLKKQTGKAPVDSQEMGLGVAVTGGAALRLGDRLALRADGRYYYEKEKYFGYGASLLFKY